MLLLSFENFWGVKEVMKLDNDVLPLNIIRGETVLSRYPVHNLTKRRGPVEIQIQKRNEKGEVELLWEVTYNSKYGQPRQLAYKLDTLIVSRRIEEAGKPVPKTIRLGSLHDICRGLGMSEGENTQTIKRAFRQNASAFITAKIGYRGTDGTGRTIEADFTRYSVVFTGETLPDGRKADAVYLILNDIYQEVLRNAPTRPLDYDYLQVLSPSPQRFYDILSYRIFAALKNKLPTANITYSEYSMFSAQERYFTWNQVKKQLYKLHKPHLSSGYITEFSHEATFDGEGRPDWILKYVPGPKAKAEFKAFTGKGKKDPVIDVESTEPQALPEFLREPELPPLTSEEHKQIENLISSFGVHSDKAELLVRAYPDATRVQIEVFPYRNKRPKDRAGWIIKAIEGVCASS